MKNNNLSDVTFHFTQQNNDNKNNNISEIQLISFLKTNLMIKKSQKIRFSCNFEKISSFGTISQKENQLTTLSRPYDLKIDNKLQLIFIADFGNYRIVVFDLNGNYLYHFKTQQNSQPVSLFVDQFEDRLLIVCDNGIYCCNKKGENFIKIYTQQINSEIFAVTMGTQTNYIYFTDINFNNITVVDINGNFNLILDKIVNS